MEKKKQSKYEREVKDVYIDSAIFEARDFLARIASQGRLERICKNHFLPPSSNLWEGEEGDMEHVVSDFPMPDLIFPDTSQSRCGNDSNRKIPKSEGPSSSGDSSTRKVCLNFSQNVPDIDKTRDDETTHLSTNEAGATIHNDLAANNDPNDLKPTLFHQTKKFKVKEREKRLEWNKLYRAYSELYNLNILFENEKLVNKTIRKKLKRLDDIEKTMNAAIRKGNIEMAEFVHPKCKKIDKNVPKEIQCVDILDLFASLKRRLKAAC